MVSSEVSLETAGLPPRSGTLLCVPLNATMDTARRLENSVGGDDRLYQRESSTKKKGVNLAIHPLPRCIFEYCFTKGNFKRKF